MASVIRLHYLIRLSASLQLERINDTAAIWSLIELNIGIICISIPPLKAVVVSVVPSFFSDDASDKRVHGASSSALSDATLPVGSVDPHARKDSDITLVFLGDSMAINSKLSRQNRAIKLRDI